MFFLKNSKSREREGDRERETKSSGRSLKEADLRVNYIQWRQDEPYTVSIAINKKVCSFK